MPVIDQRIIRNKDLSLITSDVAVTMAMTEKLDSVMRGIYQAFVNVGNIMGPTDKWNVFSNIIMQFDEYQGYNMGLTMHLSTGFSQRKIELNTNYMVLAKADNPENIRQVQTLGYRTLYIHDIDNIPVNDIQDAVQKRLEHWKQRAEMYRLNKVAELEYWREQFHRGRISQQ